MAIFVFGVFFFELGIGISGFRFGAAWPYWPVRFIGLGIVSLLSNLLPRRNHPLSDLEEETQWEDEHVA